MFSLTSQMSKHGRIMLLKASAAIKETIVPSLDIKIWWCVTVSEGFMSAQKQSRAKSSPGCHAESFLGDINPTLLSHSSVHVHSLEVCTGLLCALHTSGKSRFAKTREIRTRTFSPYVALCISFHIESGEQEQNLDDGLISWLSMGISKQLSFAIAFLAPYLTSRGSAAGIYTQFHVPGK